MIFQRAAQTPLERVFLPVAVLKQNITVRVYEKRTSEVCKPWFFLYLFCRSTTWTNSSTLCTKSVLERTHWDSILLFLSPSSQLLHIYVISNADDRRWDDIHSPTTPGRIWRASSSEHLCRIRFSGRSQTLGVVGRRGGHTRPTTETDITKRQGS